MSHTYLPDNELNAVIIMCFSSTKPLICDMVFGWFSETNQLAEPRGFFSLDRSRDRSIFFCSPPKLPLEVLALPSSISEVFCGTATSFALYVSQRPLRKGDPRHSLGRQAGGKVTVRLYNDWMKVHKPAKGSMGRRLRFPMLFSEGTLDLPLVAPDA